MYNFKLENRHTSEKNIKMDFKEIWHDNVEWICVAQYTSQWWDFIYLVPHHQILYNVTNFVTI
jgi:hypothetical protein